VGGECYLGDEQLRAPNDVLVDYLHQLQIAAHWGTGRFSSSDGRSSAARGRAASADAMARVSQALQKQVLRHRRLLVSWAAPFERPARGERSHPAVLDMTSLIQLRDRRVGDPLAKRFVSRGSAQRVSRLARWQRKADAMISAVRRLPCGNVQRRACAS
jgi:hypothetical protein